MLLAVRALLGSRPLPGRWSVVPVSFNFLSNLFNARNFQPLVGNYFFVQRFSQCLSFISVKCYQY